MTTKTQSKTVIGRLRKEFAKKYVGLCIFGETSTFYLLEQFILQEQTALLDRILDAIENMEKPVIEVGCSGTHDEGEEYNQALDDFKALLLEMRKTI